MIKKNDIYCTEIIDQGIDGEGIAKIDNFTIFIKDSIKGEKVKICITKVLSSYAYGKVIEILETSKHRRNIDCYTYKQCGGCNLRHIDYEETLKIKTNIVKNCIYKSIKNHIEVNACIGMEQPFYYRNKLQYPIGINKEKNAIMGIYTQRTHNIIETRNCLIQDKLSQKIANELFNILKKYNIHPYNEKNGSGIVRHIIIRIGKSTNEVIVTIVLNKEKLINEQKIIKEITEKFKEIKTIAKNINTENTNVILGNKTQIIYGSGYIRDYLGEYQFKISPVSFYQVNPIQTEKLYNKAIQYAELTGKEIVFDLYCGIGTIGIFASKYAKKVYGIEIVEQAIEDAKENANINEISNIEFYAGKVEKLLPELLKENKADVVFIDPPRKGLDENTIKVLLELESRKIIYISCNPATLARDLSMLTQKYKIKEIQPIDMFPFTSHVEVVTLLELKNHQPS